MEEFHGDSWLGFHRFIWSGDRYPEWFISLNELPKARGYGWAHDKDDGQVKPLRSVSGPVRSKLLSTLIENAGYSWFSDIPVSASLVDPDSSFVFMKGSECIAALIIERIGNIYYPVAMMQDCDADTFRSFISVVLHKLSDSEKGFIRIAPHEKKRCRQS